MKCLTQMRVRCRVRDSVTGKVIRKTRFKHNLVVDAGLNSLAQKSTGVGPSSPASSFGTCVVGSGTNANSFASGAITFTQSGTTVTASGGFFTSAMVGGILKYGTGSGGTEQYITAFTSSTQVTVSSSATVGATVGTVWMVQQTALQTFLYQSSSYQTSTGSCSTTFGSGQVTFQRTFNFAIQSSPYTVNEIGWSPGGTAICGRLVLGSSVTVSPTQFLQVVLQMVVSYSPTVPTAVGNTGTGINNAGSAMIEAWNISAVATSGATQPQIGISSPLDGYSPQLNLIVASYSQNGTPSTTTPISPTKLTSGSATWTYVAASVGIMQLSFLSTTFATSGQTMTGYGISGNNGICFDVQLTTPFTLPTGTFFPQTVFQITYSRTLTN
jgi:hypothetical protein